MARDTPCCRKSLFPASSRSVRGGCRAGWTGLAPVFPVPAALLQRGLASAHVFQPCPVAGVRSTPAGWERKQAASCWPCRSKTGVRRGAGPCKGAWWPGTAGRGALGTCWRGRRGRHAWLVALGMRRRRDVCPCWKSLCGCGGGVGAPHPWATAGTPRVNPGSPRQPGPWGTGVAVGGNELCPWLGAVPFQREPEAGRERVAASRTRPEKRGVERKSIACVCLGPEEPAGPGLGCASGLWQRLAKGDVPGHRRAEGWQLLTALSPRTCPCRALPARGGCGG